MLKTFYIQVVFDKGLTSGHLQSNTGRLDRDVCPSPLLTP